ncbi:hypothetical protein Dimus_037843 [Dionaea muscipula]
MFDSKTSSTLACQSTFSLSWVSCKSLSSVLIFKFLSFSSRTFAFSCRTAFLAESLSTNTSNCLRFNLSTSSSSSLIFCSELVAASFSFSYFATTAFRDTTTASISFFSSCTCFSFSSISFFNFSCSSSVFDHLSLSFFHVLISSAIRVFCTAKTTLVIVHKEEFAGTYLQQSYLSFQFLKLRVLALYFIKLV